MKKMLALVLSLMMMLTCICAMAEDIESGYEGTWTTFNNDFELYMPNDWVYYDLTENQIAQGVVCLSSSADESVWMQMSWNPQEGQITVEEFEAVLKETTDMLTMIIDVNGIPMLMTADVASDTAGFVTMNGDEPGYYLIQFAPMSSEAEQFYSSFMMSSMRNID